MEYRIINAKHGIDFVNTLANQGWKLSTAPASTHGLKHLEAGDIVIEREKIAPSFSVSITINNNLENDRDYVLADTHIWITVGDKSVQLAQDNVKIFDVGREDETPLQEMYF